jgi:UDP-3-O-[3-hydroxymyristoyl] glucosamine N-acyltransferase
MTMATQGARYAPGCVISGDATVGAHTVVGANAVVHRGVHIGERCGIQAGAVIGEAGFGYALNEESGRWECKEHLYGVAIGDDVAIGANTCIDRGSWRTTTIEDGARIDNLVHIAHNVLVRRNAIIVAQAEISGSVEIGEGAWIGPRACIMQRVKIGERALVGMGAVVLEDVPPNVTVAGCPARVINPNEGVRSRM